MEGRKGEGRGEDRSGRGGGEEKRREARTWRFTDVGVVVARGRRRATRSISMFISPNSPALTPAPNIVNPASIIVCLFIFSNSISDREYYLIVKQLSNRESRVVQKKQYDIQMKVVVDQNAKEFQARGCETRKGNAKRGCDAGEFNVLDAGVNAEMQASVKGLQRA